MKYDFFKDFNQKHTLDCYNLYSELFKGVKFIPKTYYLVSDSKDKDGKNNGYISVDVKDPNNNNIIKLYISVFKTFPTSYHVHDIFFRYDNEYFIISDIHYENEGFSYKCECYNINAMDAVCETKKTNLPRPEHFKELKLPTDAENYENMPHYYKGNSETEDISRVRVSYNK